jgi:deoxycytidine triphosphate deaminase
MARIISEDELKKAIQANTFIKNGHVENAEGVKYDFRMSPRVLKADFKTSVDMSKLTEQQRANLCVDPGEVVFVLTEETLKLPRDIIANLSPKRKLSHHGIMVLGGFCIDPLYEGRLLVGLYNFSTTSFPLIPGKKLIAAVFYKLDEQELSEFKKPETAITDFPEELVDLMKHYKPISVQGLFEQMNALAQKYDDLRKDFHDREDWFTRFQGGLNDLLKGLEKETEERKETEREFRDDLKKVYWNVAKLAAVGGAVGAVLLTILMAALPKFFTFLK